MHVEPLAAVDLMVTFFVELEYEQTVEGLAATVTASVELAEAATAKLLPFAALLGADIVTVMV